MLFVHESVELDIDAERNGSCKKASLFIAALRLRSATDLSIYVLIAMNRIVSLFSIIFLLVEGAVAIGDLTSTVQQEGFELSQCRSGDQQMDDDGSCATFKSSRYRSSELTLAYWNIRGLSEPVVLILEYLDVKYHYKRYEEANKEEWFEKDKPAFKGDFANLPYLVDGDVLLTESMAIIRYIGRKFKVLYPENEEEERRCDIVQGAVLDLRTDFSRLCYSENFAELRQLYIEELPAKLSKFEKVLRKHTWLTGM